MYIGEILTHDDYQLTVEDTIGYALDRMNELHVHQLPVINQTELLGVIHEEDLLSAHNDNQSLSSLFVSLRFVYLFEDQHIFDALQYTSVHQLDLVPVLDKDKMYVGVVTLSELSKAINVTLGNDNSGAIIVLEVGKNDVAFSHVAHIVESENMRILNMSLRNIEESTKTEITIKVDKQNISALIASFWRFDYTVKATFNDGNQHSDIKDRYDILMNYLNL
ncbi:CBS domain-containing protein [Sphingobacterium wenxiniae]|uniref:CBS domain-containing protein n=1 Tax=Sphingobacterium wenxiniae TaxID=683125 RepID=A0A1I6P6W2_9SPHI|nr:CBS domain-containing protein [Sphingobacterium wenxiniae]SFS35919.1 CBS domain-containing protein [Sphingobacterium wenxiniae]